MATAEQSVQPQQPGQENGQADDAVLEKAAVKRWLGRIDRDEVHWDKDFKRMRENQRFVSGIQWDGQEAVRDSEDRYICNLTIRMVEQKVAQLYARNPKVEAKRRDRMDFAMWDGSVEMLTDAMGGVMGMAETGPNLESMALMADFMRGRQTQALVDKVCKTLERLYQYQVDTASPDFKEQMKQLVRRVVICGVGYCLPSFVRQGAPPLSTVAPPTSLVDRIKLLKVIAAKLSEEKITAEDPQVETMKSLVLSIQKTATTQDEYVLDERIDFDFPPATSVVPDKRCRSLKEFVAARHISIRYDLPPDEVNAMFGLEGDDAVKGTTVLAPEDDEAFARVDIDSKADPLKATKVRLYRVFDAETKTHFFVAKGHKKYVLKPEPLDPCVSGFWPLFALTFNDIEVDNDKDSEVSIFPPSDVDLIRDAQKEWNRTRDALRAQRNANAPTYLARKGMLTEADKDHIRDRTPNEVIELEGLPADKTPDQVIGVLQVARIDPAVYDTAPLEQDIQLAAGAQQADIGPAQPDVTATVGRIAEESKMTVSSSNIDDLNGFLSRIARACGEMDLQAMSPQTVQRIVGPGAVFPDVNRSEYLNQIELTIKAGSNGKPNKAIEMSNAQIFIPLLLQSGANPIAVIEEIVRRMGDDLDVQKFFPLPGQAMMANGPAAKQNGAVAGQPPVGQGPVAGPPALSPPTATAPPPPMQPMMAQGQPI